MKRTSTKPTTGALPPNYDRNGNGRVPLIDPEGHRVDVELSELAHRDARGNVTYALKASKVAAGWRFHTAGDDVPVVPDTAA